MSWLEDTQFETYTLEKAEPGESGWSLDLGGCGIFCASDECQATPQPGEEVRLFGKGFGFPVRGIVIGARVYRYATEEQAEEERRLQLEAAALKRSQDYEAKRADFDRDVAALPDPLRLRIERFRNLKGDTWRHQFEPYELFVCQQAAVLRDALQTVEALQAFGREPHEEQRRRVPALSDGHSGNTFGASCLLARMLIECPERVPHMHGALCPLVGCVEYGCFAAHEAKEGSDG
jgi:hypothetical protein